MKFLNQRNMKSIKSEQPVFAFRLVALSLTLFSGTALASIVSGGASRPVGNNAAGNAIAGIIETDIMDGTDNNLAEHLIIYDVNNLGNIRAGAPPNSVASWDIQFSYTNGAPAWGRNEVNINQFILNNTGVDWTDFHMTLGTGIGKNADGTDRFNPTRPADGLYFTDPTGPTPRGDSDAFGGPSNSSTSTMDFDGGTVAAGSLLDVWSVVHIPQSMFDAFGKARFTLRMHATVSEVPSSGSLAMLGIGGLVAARRRR